MREFHAFPEIHAGSREKIIPYRDGGHHDAARTLANDNDVPHS